MCFFRWSAFVLKYWYWLQLCGLIATCKDFSWSFAIWLPIQTPRLMVWSSRFKENWIQESSNVRLWLKSVSNHIGRLWSSDKKEVKQIQNLSFPPEAVNYIFKQKLVISNEGFPASSFFSSPEYGVQMGAREHQSFRRRSWPSEMHFILGTPGLWWSW